ncbi:MULTISPECIES: 4-carboxy-4-hydroxy-2-oxoadipate aldolase/oxaloacetate decarboxylase [unclassified Streptomyces]|uniref:4-carboxy-4-hydroxy-2-oxoadipate aldolase/oxaloacetate decarboxylase n=1 Tax=unclassified Streptomyces TaxID=2593676 RepID=UPI002DDB73AE|nr:MULTISPECIES: 4-carboxy-4-hydroxy-2-oxoadipate aldolase/oxaloacetate decarboxylase [unclassified Streptomyces]WSA96451.1 4-carboxy-4-hydroxy-2-oxoadipate aldolase/oxaloacetate decarboxylase [Streptomyces sp. NBC_01795]WSB80863.1 4-carboxy-4-hydroxy-2-oxoadipate aldolase/oxaloacetate decarboxylase [Streptomyces sp. NBC_01775]WSS10925.1 4-carboxy-4-hydroxy-2-oxoadipate aldolase/oxaloacetate decarboxylase [Streptomyces sp. NBC_01186]WSS39629.1 4-carboxy-4-hydroxy-2-oxoadipate aldolase/oxaloacet
MIRVSTAFDRPDPGVTEQLSRFSAATIHEAQGRLGALDSTLKPVDHRMSLCGPAFTVECAPRDNLMLQTAIAYARPGDVIVVSAGAYAEAGSFGDVLANACKAKGLGGLITDTGVRDTEDLRRLGFPVFSHSVCMKGTVKETVGPMCEPVTVGGQLVRPGDVVRADADGVVVVRREDAASVVAASQQRVDTETEYIAAYRAGKSVTEICGLTPLLAAKGLIVDEGDQDTAG